jgi:MFS family permease
MRAFRHRNFRTFWFGALVSNSGTWLQNLAIPFVLVEITGGATWAGVAAFSSLFPATVLGPLAGNVADRFDRRRVLLIGQSCSALAALGLFILWTSGVRDPAAIVAVAALGGIISGFTIPTWQSFIPLLVPVEDLPSAIPLNSLQFNTARAIGPALGGAFIFALGPGAAFLANAISFGAVLIAILLINPGDTNQEKQKRPVFAGFVDSVRYVRTQPGIGMGIALAAVVAFFGFPVVTFVVVFAEFVYQVDARAVGLLSAMLGLGAIIAVPLVTGMFGDLRRATMVRFSLPLYGASIIVFGTSTSALQGALGLLAAGACFLTIVATSNTAVQSIVADHIRGRVMATRIMTFTGSYPMGTLLQTTLSDRTSPRLVVSLAGGVILGLGLILSTKPSWLSRLDDPPDTTPLDAPALA